MLSPQNGRRGNLIAMPLNRNRIGCFDLFRAEGGGFEEIIQMFRHANSDRIAAPGSQNSP